MDHLWTPWRYSYISKPGEPEACFLCAAAQTATDRESLVVHRGERNLVILNQYPYTSCHVMIAPY